MSEYVTYFNFEPDDTWCDGIYDEEQVQTNAQNIKSEMNVINDLIKTSLTSVAPQKRAHNKIKRPIRNQVGVQKNKIGRSISDVPVIQAKQKIKNQINIKFKSSK
jgi:hypothetical protein